MCIEVHCIWPCRVPRRIESAAACEVVKYPIFLQWHNVIPARFCKPGQLHESWSWPALWFSDGSTPLQVAQPGVLTKYVTVRHPRRAASSDSCVKTESKRSLKAAQHRCVGIQCSGMFVSGAAFAVEVAVPVCKYDHDVVGDCKTSGFASCQLSANRRIASVGL